MCLGILLVNKVYVVGTDELDAALLAEFNDMFVHLNLQGVYLVVGALDGCLVQLQFKVIIFTEKVLVPVHNRFGFINLVVLYELWNLASQAGRATGPPCTGLMTTAVSFGTLNVMPMPSKFPASSVSDSSSSTGGRYTE